MCIVLWMGPLCPLWAASHETKTDPNKFFSRNHAFPLRVGIKTWIKATKDIVNQPSGQFPYTTFQPGCGLGGACALGPFVEWKPLHGIGLQTGLLYAYHHLWSLQMRIKGHTIPTTNVKDFFAGVKGSFQKRLQTHSLHDLFQASIAPIALHTIHIPLHLRLYPEKTRQLVFYGGGHVILVMYGIRKVQHLSFNINLDNLRHAVTEKGIQESLKTIFEVPPDGMYDMPIDCVGERVHWEWDIGFQFHGKAGFMLGTYNLGLMFGYDCTNLFIKHD